MPPKTAERIAKLGSDLAQVNLKVGALEEELATLNGTPPKTKKKPIFKPTPK
ncbi:MAG: hypothetical protein K2W96_19315 [Gemmataceae bacterium]|nr:hypothetical protein [Gemmataceae bacterium]